MKTEDATELPQLTSRTGGLFIELIGFPLFVNYFLPPLSERIVTLGVTLSRCVCVRVSADCIGLGGEDNALHSLHAL